MKLQEFIIKYGDEDGYVNIPGDASFIDGLIILAKYYPKEEGDVWSYV